MSAPDAIGTLFAGVAAGAINTMVGSGTLITFPVLLGLGYAPVVANVSNTVGLVPGALTGTLGYRRELRGHRAVIPRLATVSVIGAVAGAIILLELPASEFRAIVPWLILVALVLILAQPWLSRWLRNRSIGPDHRPGVVTQLAVLLSAVYGAYFGAAQSIILLAILASTVDDELQRINAVKVLLAGVVNVVATIVFVLYGRVAWGPAALIAVGTTAGGSLGARIGRRLPANLFRGAVLAVGVAAAIRLLMT